MKCFKAYDIHGRIPDELSDEVACRIGRSFAQIPGPAEVVVGRDMRRDSPVLAEALSRGLNASGATVIDVRLRGTGEVFWRTAHRGIGGGLMVRASHNPMD